MFSRFHRRGQSNSTPTSPVPPPIDNTSAAWDRWETAGYEKHIAVAQRPVSSSNSNSNSNSNNNSKSTAPAQPVSASTNPAASTPGATASVLPSLPPISRMSVLTISTTEVKPDLANADKKTDALAHTRSNSHQQPPSARMAPPPVTDPALAETDGPAFIGGMALANRRRDESQDMSAAAAVAAAAAAATAAGRPGDVSSPTPISPIATTSSPPRTTTSEKRMSRQKPPPPPINTSLTPRQFLSVSTAQGRDREGRSGSKSATSFVTPTDMQSSAAAAVAAAASAVNATSDAHAHRNTASASGLTSSSAATAAAAASTRTKKSRPFLKNPVSSLLGRRKTSASTSDIGSLAGFRGESDMPVYAPIRGTRVHDFSAPRQPRVVTSELPVPTSTAAVAAAAAVANLGGTFGGTAGGTAGGTVGGTAGGTVGGSGGTGKAPRAPPVPSPNPSTAVRSPGPVSSAAQPPPTGASDTDSPAVSQSVPQPASSSYPAAKTALVTPDGALSYAAHLSKSSGADLRGPVRTPSQSALQTLNENDTLSFDAKPAPEKPAAQGVLGATDTADPSGPGPAPAQASPPRGASVAGHTRAALSDVSLQGPPQLKSSSTGTTRSRNLSLSDQSPNSNAGALPSTSATTPGSVGSSLPKHMKSTSSRFSFIVSSSEEKAMEERHRKKQAETKTAGSDAQDARYYDSDEEDFDYDAMMDDDDDFEERIPGVNADYGDEDDYHLYGDAEAPPMGAIDLPRHGAPADAGDEVDDDDASHYEDEADAPDVAPPAFPRVRVEVEDDDPEGLDPNNDQENFAGFVFQRSNPASSLVTPTTPGMLATPRDADGHVIGFAMTVGGANRLSDLAASSTATLSPVDQARLHAAMNSHRTSMASAGSVDGAGLGIQAMHLQEPTSTFQATENLDDYEAESDYSDYADPTVTAPPHETATARAPPNNDEMYFDQGLADELDFGAPDGAPFDENLFDLEDTDQYGRPLPGVFAAAQAAQAAKRAEMTASIEAAAAIQDRGAAPSAPSDQVESAEPAAHELTGASHPVSLKKQDSLTALRRQLPPILTDADRVAAYQAALSEAAFKAAAQGKFRRDSESIASEAYGGPSSPQLEGSPVDGQDSLGYLGTGLGLSLSGGGGGGLGGLGGLGAPSNTSAVLPGTSDLAGVSAGIGQQQAHLAYAYTNHDDEDFRHNFDDDDDCVDDMDDYDFDDDIIAEANAEALANDMDGFYGQEFNFYSAPAHQSAAGKGEAQLAHGGIFIPGGVGRSTSGRVVSREPNLTPITERSEYSNRNSVMSLALPPLGSSAELRSPGLAQLAMMADDGDMTLSALLRLRSKTFGGGGGGGGSQAGSSRGASPMLVPPSPAQPPESERDAGDRDSVSSFDHRLTPAQLQLLQKQYPLPVSHYQQHHRMSSGTSLLSRGAGSSEHNASEPDSECGSPTMAHLQTAPPMPPVPPMPSLPQLSSLPMSPNPAAMTSSCTPVLEEDGEGLDGLGRLSRLNGLAGLDGLDEGTHEACGSADMEMSASTMSEPLPARTSPSTIKPSSAGTSEQQQIYELEQRLLEQQRENEQMQRTIRELQLKQERMQQSFLGASTSASPSASSALASPAASTVPFAPTGLSPALLSMGRDHRRKYSADSI